MAFKYKKFVISCTAAIFLILLYVHIGSNPENGENDQTFVRRDEPDGDLMKTGKESDNARGNAKDVIFGSSTKERCPEGKSRKLPQVIFIGISKAGTG